MNKETAPIKRIYVAGPLTYPDPMVNTHRALKVADRIMEMGFVPYIPHLSVFHNIMSPKDYETWMEYDFQWLDACDAMFRIRGKSSGADREEERANKNGQPIFRYLYDLHKIRR